MPSLYDAVPPEATNYYGDPPVATLDAPVSNAPIVAPVAAAPVAAPAEEVPPQPAPSDEHLIGQHVDVSTPSHAGAKFQYKNPNGTLHYSNGVDLNPDTGSISWQAGDRYYSKTGPYNPAVYMGTVPKEPTVKTHSDPVTGKLWNITDPKKPTEIKLGTGAPEGVVGEDVLKGLSEQDKSTIRKMANYEWPVPPGGIRNPHQLDLLQKATLFDPTFAPSEYTIRQKTKQEYTSGSGAFKNIRSLNTLAEHLLLLQNAANQLGNTNYPPLNAPKNYVENKLLGKKAVPAFNTSLNAVQDELVQLLASKAITDSEKKHWDDVMTANSSPEQIDGTIQAMAKLARERLDALQQGYEGVMRKPLDIQIIGPKASNALVKLGAMSPEEVAAHPGGAQGYGRPAPQAAPTAPAPPPLPMTGAGRPPREGEVFVKPNGDSAIWQNGQWVLIPKNTQ